jgi:peroxiredoxin
MSKLIPRKPVPDLEVRTVNDEEWNVYEKTPERFIMIVFFRGLHCPICRKYLSELEKNYDEFVSQGVDLIAISSDTKARALETQDRWKLKKTTIGYGLSIETGRKWGLFISKAIKENEPDLFIEPGIFLIKPDKTLYGSIVSTMPFARPPIKEILRSIAGINKSNYPARGEA